MDTPKLEGHRYQPLSDDVMIRQYAVQGYVHPDIPEAEAEALAEKIWREKAKDWRIVEGPTTSYLLDAEAGIAEVRAIGTVIIP